MDSLICPHVGSAPGAASSRTSWSRSGSPTMRRIVAMVLFTVADSVGWLFAARELQGITTGLALGAAGAALLDLHPRQDGQKAGLVNGVVSAGSLGIGAIVAAVLAQYAPDPLVTP